MNINRSNCFIWACLVPRAFSWINFLRLLMIYRCAPLGQFATDFSPLFGFASYIIVAQFLYHAQNKLHSTLGCRPDALFLSQKPPGRPNNTSWRARASLSPRQILTKGDFFDTKETEKPFPFSLRPIFHQKLHTSHSVYVRVMSVCAA